MYRRSFIKENAFARGARMKIEIDIEYFEAGKRDRE